MPKLYEYFGIVIQFYSNDYEPIHVHCKFQDQENNVQITSEKITKRV
ncbi:MAG: DUF4160 domain-containing protein [Candidatus Kapabacteria bacterium]|nr:DUF4160 domain-containing protein [Candidatus Kapabacteria bacterium]